MPTVLAVQLADEQATFIKARTEPGQPITLLSFRRLSRAIQPLEADGHDATSSPEAAPEELPAEPQMIEAEELDDTLALLESQQILYNVLELPFRDPKKIEQVAPLQIQDTLPFDLEEFLIDSIVSAPLSGGEYRVVSSLIPKREIAESLAYCASVGTEPRVITTGAAALAALGRHCHPNETGLVAYLELARSRVSLAVLQRGQALLFRDFPIAPVNGSGPVPVLAEIFRNVACSLARAEESAGEKVSELFTIGAGDHQTAIQSAVSAKVRQLELDELVVNDAPEDVEFQDISWSLGLFAAELERAAKRGDRQLVDFRQGPFAFHRMWGEVWSALNQELFYVVLAVILGLVWWGGKLYSSFSALSSVETRIEELIQQALPGETVPEREEVSYLQAKLDNLEEELRGLGSLSSLSPLEALKELSIAMGQGIDVALDSVSIGSTRILLRGSVAENRQVADLSAALKGRPNKFCDVKVDPKGKTATGRTGFAAELTLCE